MAPMKRFLTSAASSETKRKCQAVSQAVMKSDELSDSCKAMLSGMSTSALDTFQDDRHPWQVSIVDMVKATLTSVEASMSKHIAVAGDEVGKVDVTKAARRDGLASAELELRGKVDAVAAKKVACDESAAAAKIAKAAVADAILSQSSGDEEFNLMAGKKKSLESFKKDAFAPLKDGVLGIAEARNALKTVARETDSRSNKFDLEKPMVQAALEALKQAPADRSSFLVTSLQQMEEKIETLIAGLGEQLDQGGAAKQQRAAAVATVVSTKENVDAVFATCSIALKKARAELVASENGLKAAKRDCANFLPDIKKLMDGFDKEKLALQKFQSTVLVGFKDLEVLTPPPPSPVVDDAIEDPVADESAEANPESADVSAVVDAF